MSWFIPGHFFMFKTKIGSDLEEAQYWLEQGELVGIPTETVYGLAANGLNPIAVAKIYAVKQRPQFNPLILHAASPERIEKFVAGIPEIGFKLMSQFSPGPLTYLLPKSSLVPEIITAGNDRVAVRIPEHPLTLGLLEKLDFPLAAPSANPSGYVSPVSAAHVLDGLGGKIPYILDGGTCSVGLESTIIGFENDTAVIHRLGTVTAEQIRSYSQVKVKISLSHSAPSAPGQLKSHYATRTPLCCGDINQLLGKFEGQKIGVLSFTQTYLVGVQKNIVLSKEGKLDEAASNLFNAMRELDSLELDIIITEPFPDEGVGLAINDRLARAAYRVESE